MLCFLRLPAVRPKHFDRWHRHQERPASSEFQLTRSYLPISVASGARWLFRLTKCRECCCCRCYFRRPCCGYPFSIYRRRKFSFSFARLFIAAVVSIPQSHLVVPLQGFAKQLWRVHQISLAYLFRLQYERIWTRSYPWQSDLHGMLHILPSLLFFS